MKTKHHYTLQDRNNQPVQIDLANYKCICTITGARKSFYHKYLYNLIQKRYGGNIDTFRTTYISRAGRPSKTQAERLNEQIDRARAKLQQLINKQQQLVNN